MEDKPDMDEMESVVGLLAAITIFLIFWPVAELLRFFSGARR